MNVDEAKDYVFKTLLRPLEELAHTFQSEFCKHGYYNDLVLMDWAKNTVAIEFKKNPSSDEIRYIIFGLYEREWGGKPEGLEVAYKSMQPGLDNDPFNGGKFPIKLLISVGQDLRKALAPEAFGIVKLSILDDKDFNDWKAKRAHDIIKRATRVTHVIKTPDRPAVDPGQAVPVFHVGLYKV